MYLYYIWRHKNAVNTNNSEGWKLNVSLLILHMVFSFVLSIICPVLPRIVCQAWSLVLLIKQCKKNSFCSYISQPSYDKVHQKLSQARETSDLRGGTCRSGLGNLKSYFVRGSTEWKSNEDLAVLTIKGRRERERSVSATHYFSQGIMCCVPLLLFNYRSVTRSHIFQSCSLQMWSGISLPFSILQCYYIILYVLIAK